MTDPASGNRPPRSEPPRSEPSRPEPSRSKPSGASVAPITEIVERMADTAQGERVTMGDTLEAFGRRSYLPVLIVPALVVMSPLSGVPLMSSICGAVIALISAQMILPGVGSLRIPGFIARRNISGRRARAATAKLSRLAHWLDSRAQTRLKWLIDPPGRTVLEVVCLLCGLAMPVLELVPFSSSILGGAVLLIATGLLARDGLFALAGLAVLPVFGTVLALGIETLNAAGG